MDMSLGLYKGLAGSVTRCLGLPGVSGVSSCMLT
jgi:hypothetical protein